MTEAPYIYIDTTTTQCKLQCVPIRLYIDICREDVAAQIPAECLTCMVVPVFPMSCLYLISITDFHLAIAHYVVSHVTPVPLLLYSAAWDSLS